MPKALHLTTFLGETVPVELYSEVLAHDLEANSLTLQVARERYFPQMHDYYGTLCETTFRPPERCGEATVRFDFCTPEIIRIRAAPTPEIPENMTPMLVARTEEPVELRFFESPTHLYLHSRALNLEIRREPWQFTLKNQRGEVLLESKPTDLDCLRRSERQWNPPEQRWTFLHRYAYPMGYADHGSLRAAFASFSLFADEHIYGFGEGFGFFDKRGTRQDLWHREGFSNASPGSYKCIPFYLSSRGYGLYLNSSNAITARVGDLEHTSLSLIIWDTNFLDLFVIQGDGPKEILPRYHSLTGRPTVPPKWSFGLWMGRISYNSQAQVESVASQLRTQQIPCDVIHIDTDWFTEDWACDWQFGLQKFPDPKGMLEKLREQGFRVCLWQWPISLVHTHIYRELSERQFLVKRSNGMPYVFSGFLADGGLLDISNSQAVQFYQERLKALFTMGVSAIKADFGENAPPEGVYSGVSAESMHNLYPLLYNQAVFEATESYYGPGQAVIWARSAWAGSQRYPVHWSGDGIARFEDLPCVLRSALSFGLSGFPFYSHDIGGFVGVPSPELYIRWAQIAFFSSHVRAHGVPPREPWAYGSEALAIFRRYAELRYRLLPYLYSEARRSAEHGLPIMRPLLVDFPRDPVCQTVDNAYLFGPSMLVAPIMDASNRRQVYLPEGRWVDFWSKEVIDGGQWREVEAPLDILPLYVRAGAILPLGPLMQHTGEKPLDPLTVEIYVPEQEGEFVIHDEGGTDIKIRYRREGEVLSLEVSPTPGQVVVQIYGWKDNPSRKLDGRKGITEHL